MNNQLEKVTLSKGTQYQVDLVNQIDKATQEMGHAFSDYGRQCVINAIANLITTCKTNDIKFETIDATMVKIALQNVGYTELNFNATPAEAYFDLRKANGGYTISIKPQGAGNEKLTRKFGVNVKELKTCLLIHEGDEYTLPGFDGEKMTPFKWTQKSLDKKVIMVVYPLLKCDGTYEYLIATREGIKPNLIAQIRQNNLYTFMKTNAKGFREVDQKARDEFYEMVNTELEKLSVDQIIADPRWRKELSPTYTSGGSCEAMVIRKMKNNALKQYPREYSNEAITNAVKDMFEDKDESLIQTKNNVVDVDPVEKVERDINEHPSNKEVVDDFEVEEEEVEVVEQPKKEEVKATEPKSTDNYDEEF